jgi:hypothetical protein
LELNTTIALVIGGRDNPMGTGFDTLMGRGTPGRDVTDAARLRDSTQILLPRGALDGLRTDLEERFVVTVRREKRRVRIIGSPVEIKGASEFLARNGVRIA